MSDCKSIRDELFSEPAEPLLREGEDNPFRNIWEAEVFAIGNLLIKQGFMTQREWVEVFSEEIKAAQERGDPDRGDTYYDHWASALERVLIERGLTDRETLTEQQRLWELARKNTPHGVALSLDNAFLDDHGHDEHGHDHGHHHHHHHHGETPSEELLKPIFVCADTRNTEAYS
ncbi:MAG: nitrile hydratase accessory protein [Candidatus Methylumidiphilus sp.]